MFTTNINLDRLNKKYQVPFQKQVKQEAIRTNDSNDTHVSLSKDHFNHLLIKTNPLISFTGNSQGDLIKVVDNAIAQLSQLQLNSSYNSPQLQAIIKNLDAKLGTTGFEVTDLDTKSESAGVAGRPENDLVEGGIVKQRDIDSLGELPTVKLHSGLDLDSLKKEPKKLQKLLNTLNAMKAATNYNPTVKDFGNYQLTIHNNQLANMLASDYTTDSFKQLFDLCDSKGVFKLNVDKAHGLPKTSDIETGENWEMSARFWVTDTCRNIDLMKKDPENRQQITNAIESVARFYSNQQQAFEKIIETPSLYTPYINNPDKDASFNYEGKVDPMIGVGHIFLPKNFDEDPSWFNRRRLESIGLFLKTSTEAIMAKMGNNENWGYEKAEDIPQDVIDSIATVAKYLQAIDYPYAPSAGNWEEIPLPGGLTWDTESIKEGFKSLNKLLHSKKYDNNPEIKAVRNRLLQTKHSDLLSNSLQLESLVKAGETRVEKYSTQEAPGIRDKDSSLVFITHSSIPNRNTIKVINRNLDILKTLEDSLVRDNGITRYAPFNFKLSNGQIAKSPDSYLTYGYDIAVTPDGKISLEMGDYKESFGSKDCSDPEVFAARSKLSPGDECTAQWFMVSDMSKGYGVQLEKLLDIYENVTDKSVRQKLLPKIAFTYKKETEYINRGFARITGESTKANGEKCPEYRIPEAYMAVPSLDGKVKFLPGTNTPLTWAETSLNGASEQYIKNLDRLEKLGLAKEVISAA
ncbi:MAG: hypothetical protein AB1782_21110 [Cyanobacteriota bacterium]